MFIPALFTYSFKAHNIDGRNIQALLAKGTFISVTFVNCRYMCIPYLEESLVHMYLPLYVYVHVFAYV